MMEKRGVIDENTPDERDEPNKQAPAQNLTKEATDARAEHVTTRLEDAVKAASKKP